MPTEPIQGGPYPLQSDRADVPGDIKKVVDWAAPKLNMTFTSTGERDAQVPSPEDGMECFVGTGATATKYVRMNGTWVPTGVGAVIAKRGDGPATSVPSGQMQEYNPGPVSYSYGGIVADGGGFIVPTAGVYAVSAGLRLQNSGPEFQLRIRAAGNVVANQTVANSRYLNCNCIVIVNSGSKFQLDLYNNGSSTVSTAAPGFGGPYLAVALIAPTVMV